MSTLTDDQKRAKIAESLGIDVYSFCGDFDADHDMYEDPKATAHLDPSLPKIPYFRCHRCDGSRWGGTVWHENSKAKDHPFHPFSSYDAAAQMRAALTEEERPRFVHALKVQTGALNAWDVLNATPAQQCEAFGKVRGLF